MSSPTLDDRIEQLSAIEAFPPPPGFAAHAREGDPADYAVAAAEGPAWWAEQARQRLDWQTPFSTVLDDSNRRPDAGRASPVPALLLRFYGEAEGNRAT